MKKRAIFSVADKTGVVDCARRVLALGYDILSTSGTKLALEAGGLAVSGVSEVTDFPECLDGRLKTLHPLIHGGLLAERSNPDHMAQSELLGIVPIDLAVVNLHSFEKLPPEDAKPSENIDIGRPALLRAAASNWRNVVVLIDPADYDAVLTALENGGLSPALRYELANKAFESTAQYDARIAACLRAQAKLIC